MNQTEQKRIKRTIPSKNPLKSRRRYFVFLLFLCYSSIETIQAKTLLYGQVGGSYIEDFFSVIYQTQLTPSLKTGMEVIHPVFFSKNLQLHHEIHYQLYGGNRYWKNKLIYYTDKTYSVSHSLDYKCLFEQLFFPFFSILYGSSAYFIVRSDQYSVGVPYYYTNIRITPFLPTLSFGVVFRITRFFQLRLLQEIGGTVGLELRSRNNKNSKLSTNYILNHILHLDSSLRIYHKLWLYFSWQNILNANLNTHNLTGKIFWNNTIAAGVKFEI